MTHVLARLIVRVSAWLAPGAIRRRWREEWLAELEASEPRHARRAFGAPWDALSSRWTVRTVRHPHRIHMSGLAADLRQAFRALRRSPAYVLLTTFCLGVGLAASMGVFSLANALVYGEQPGIVERRGLVRVFLGYDGATRTESIVGGRIVAAELLSQADLALLPNRGRTLAGLAGEGPLAMAVVGPSGAVGVAGALVSGEYFGVLGTSPQLGRLLGSGDDRPGAPAVAVIGDWIWRSEFGARPDIIGRTIVVSGRAVTVVGVAPPRFSGLNPLDIGAPASAGRQVWLPLALAPSWPGTPAELDPWLNGIARLLPGASRAGAETELAAGAGRIERAYPSARRHVRVVTRPHGFGIGEAPVTAVAILILFLSVPLSVLAIACANVANLQLARATDRARELAVRMSLGATRGQLVRLLSLESLLLSSGAAAVGTAGAVVLLRLWAPRFPMTIPFDGRVAAFAILLAAGTTMATGMAPAWIVLRRTLAAGLVHSPRLAGPAHARLRHGLVVVQVALSVALLFMAALFERSLATLNGAVPPLAREVLVTELALTTVAGYTPADARRFVDAVESTLKARPAVEAVGFADFLPSGGAVAYRASDAAAVQQDAAGGFVSTGWFTVMRARLLAGRLLEAADAGRPVAVVNETLAHQLAGSDGPVARTVGTVFGLNDPGERGGSGRTEPTVIVGVIADPFAALAGTARPAIYRPLPRAPPTSLVLLTRSTDADAAVTNVRQALAAIDAHLPWVRSATIATRIASEVEPIRYVALSIGTFGTLAFGLSLAGLYAVLAYVVSLRRREIGVRVALGARPRDVMRLVVGQSVRLVVIGGGAGFALAVPLAFAIRAALIGVSPVDPLAVGPTVAALIGVSIVAAAVPARRAARVDPVRALRDE